ncbi:MAG: c-type cytochrome [Burkholderiaceae bacterium]|nr:c-type cytochrome [Burkholderiaceae bacterium]
MTRTVLAGAATALLLIAAGYDSVGRTADAAGPVAPSTVGAAVDAHEVGRAVYNFRCYFCHGYSGDARTLAASYLAPQPRDFRAATAAELPRDRIAAAVREGRPGTAMKSFGGILSDAEIDAVAGFVAREFVLDKASNTAYHTAENGWPEHQRFAVAFPFARGERALDAPVESLSAGEREGRRLYLSACVSCHDRGRVLDEGPAWSARPVSYPRMGFEPGQPNTPPVDAVSSASVYAKHEVVPQVAGLTPRQQRGQALFQANCAFCHGGDGTGKNWIGQFMEPKARDLTQYSAQTLPPQRLRQVIRDGLPGTSMPAWRAVLKPAEIDAIGAYVERVMFAPGPAGDSIALRR